MVNFNICKKCQHCSHFSKGEFDDDGDISVRPHIRCGINSEPAYMMMDDSVPDDCPFEMHHTLSTQMIPDFIALNLSGPRLGKYRKQHGV